MRYPFDSEKKINLGFWASYLPEIAAEVGHTNHWGIDFNTLSGIDPIYAPEGGIVRFAGQDRGLGVRFDGVSGTWRIWHLSKLLVSTGQQISEGQLIGIAGEDHTHVELSKGSLLIDWLEKLKEATMPFDWNPTIKSIQTGWFSNSFPKVGLSQYLNVAFDEQTKRLNDKAVELQNKVKELEKGFEPVGTLYRKKV